MGVLYDLIKGRKDSDEEEAGKKGEEDLKEIEKELLEEKEAFVPKVDLSLPVEIPEGCEINECGEIIRKDIKEEPDNER